MPRNGECVANPSSFEALARAGNRPLALLERDLDIVLEEARRLDAAVLLLDYPNPSDDHAALARLIEEYATSRATPRVSLRSGFAGYGGLRVRTDLQRERGLLNSYVRLEPIFPWSDSPGVEALVTFVNLGVLAGLAAVPLPPPPSLPPPAAP